MQRKETGLTSGFFTSSVNDKTALRGPCEEDGCPQVAKCSHVVWNNWLFPLEYTVLSLAHFSRGHHTELMSLSEQVRGMGDNAQLPRMNASLMSPHLKGNICLLLTHRVRCAPRIQHQGRISRLEQKNSLEPTY